MFSGSVLVAESSSSLLSLNTSEHIRSIVILVCEAQTKVQMPLGFKTAFYLLLTVSLSFKLCKTLPVGLLVVAAVGDIM